MKRTKLCAVAVLLLASVWAFGQSIDQVINDLDAERYTAAIEGANKLVATSPNPDTYFLQGYVLMNNPEYYRSQNIADATKAFQAGDELGGKKGSPLNQVGLGMVKLASGDIPGAKAIFDAVKKATKSKQPDILYRIAEAYTLFPDHNDPAEAVLTIDEALEKSKVKNNPEYYIVKADAYLLKEDGGSAMNALQNAERIGTKKGKVLAKMAQIWLQSRNYRDALARIEEGKSAAPDFAPIYKYESSYYQTFGDFKKSAEAASNYLKYSDGDVKAKLRYAKLAFLAKDYISLKRVLGEIKGSTKDPYIHRMEGIVNYEEENYTESIKDFEAFIKANPRDENFGLDYGYIGRAYLKMTSNDDETNAKNETLGLQNIEKAVSLQDSTMDYYEEAANIFASKANYARAAEMQEKSVLNNKDAHAGDIAGVGTSYFRAQNWAKADEYFDKALVEYQDEWPTGYALSGFAKTYRYRDDSTMNATYPGAENFEKFLSLLSPEQKREAANKTYVIAALKALAGRDFLLNKDVESAKARIEELLEIDPNDQDAINMLHRFRKQLDPDYVIPGSEEDKSTTSNR